MPTGTNSRLISKEFDREVENIHWDKKGNGLYFQYDDRGNTKLAYMNLKGEVTIIAESLGGLSLGRPYNAASFSVSSNDKFAYTLGSTKHLADLAVSDSKKSQRLTALNDDLFSFRNLGKVQEMWWESSYDKRKIQGWLVTPPNFDPSKKYPLILEIHGGPLQAMVRFTLPKSKLLRQLDMPFYTPIPEAVVVMVKNLET